MHKFIQFSHMKGHQGSHHSKGARVWVRKTNQYYVLWPGVRKRTVWSLELKEEEKWYSRQPQVGLLRLTWWRGCVLGPLGWLWLSAPLLCAPRIWWLFGRLGVVMDCAFLVGFLCGLSQAVVDSTPICVGLGGRPVVCPFGSRVWQIFLVYPWHPAHHSWVFSTFLVCGTLIAGN